jgi:hypothetical protein
VERNKHAKKEVKIACKRKINMACRKERLTMIGLRFLKKIVMDISHRVV